MFCNKCGAQLPDDAQFCNACGNNLQAAPAQSVDFMAILKKNMTGIIAVVALIALVFGCMNLFSALNPGAFPADSDYEIDTTFYTSLGAMVEGDKDGSYFAIFAGNILSGLASLVVAFLGISYYLKKNAGGAMYDKVFGKINVRPGLLMAVIGVAGVLLQVFMYLVKEPVGEVIKLGVHWTNWILLAVYVILGAADVLASQKK